jgi:hypothetical protein
MIEINNILALLLAVLAHFSNNLPRPDRRTKSA